MRLSKAEKFELKRIAERNNITIEEAQEIIESTYRFIRAKISQIDFKEDILEEDFNNLKTNFNLPCIGKLCAVYLSYKRINKHKKDGRNKDMD